MSRFVKRVAQNTFIFLSSQVWEAIAATGVVVIIARYLGVEGFGSYAFIFSVVNLVVPITFMGIQQVGIREIARKEDNLEKGAYLGCLLQTRIIMLGAAAIIIFVILAVMHPEPIIIYGVIIYYFAIVVGSSGELIIASFFAGEKFQYHLFVSFMERLCLLVLVALVALLDLGFLAVFCCYVVSKSVKASLAVYYLKKHFYQIIFKFNVGWIKKIIKESYLIGFGISIGLGFHHAVIILLREIINAKTAGIFAAYYNLILRCQLLSVALSRSLMPQISIAAKNNPVAYARLTKTGLLLLFVAGSLLAIILWPFKGFIIRFLYGESFMIFIGGFGYLILLLPFLFSDNILNVAFISKGLVKNFLIAKVAGFSVGISLVGLLAAQYHFYGGLYGIISGKLVATFILAFVFFKVLSSIPAGFESQRDSSMAIRPESRFVANKKR